ncbi:virion structural protein [Aeromonas phage D3]|uniref:Uncharacterized protein n=1 Tax=Aeromonas phage D3 TaxID=2593327 RepID=A0A514TVM4_9CAUD|nr:virion structural protein [Aeromonas phage D3]QDJ97078.1 hypothetical protein D3_0080 [Aeromonas phage D3]QEP52384.1 hypothetical protein D9_0177 [Aeromonas phage D9]
MSHLAHLVEVQQDLIAKGVTSPKVHMDVGRGAYVRALAVFQQRRRLPEKDLGHFNDMILGYWNETSPIQGNLIIAELRAFNAALRNQLESLGGLDQVCVEFVRPADLDASIQVSSLNGFKAMVESLVSDTEKKLKEWLECDYFSVNEAV